MRFVLMGVLVLASSAGCRAQSVEARSNFVEDGVARDAAAVWDGEHITIDNSGVTANGGVALTATDTERVHSVARLLAVADTYDKPNADRAIDAAKATYAITTAASVTSVGCGHGMAFASAAALDSGCDALDVTVPSGNADKPLAIVVRSGTGKLVASLVGAVISTLEVHASHGIVDVAVPATLGSSITVVSETGEDITLRLPEDFAADVVAVDGPAAKVDTSEFPDLQVGKGRGAAGTGARAIVVRSGVAGGAMGAIRIVKL